jgi:hypothetical protein
MYAWLITTRQQGGVASDPYHMPDWLIILTLVIPYTFIWCIGIQASVWLYKYRTSVKGFIYRRALVNLSQGVGVIIVVSVLLRFLTTLTEQLNRLNVTPLLMVLYLLILLYAIGFGLVARGAKKLKQIEEA